MDKEQFSETMDESAAKVIARDKLDSGTSREATLDEYVNETLPADHRARRELAELQQRAQPMEGVSQRPLTPRAAAYIAERDRVGRRSERLTVASRLLAAVLCDLRRLRRDDPLQDQERLVADAVWYADQLLARVDESEPQPESLLQNPQPPFSLESRTDTEGE